MTLRKTLSIILISVLTCSAAFAQSDYKTQIDRQGEKILIGKLSLPILANDSSFHWFYQGINTYEPDQKNVNIIKEHKDEFSIVAIIGTWDDLSQKTISALYRTLIDAGYPIRSIKLYGVDEKLNALRDDMDYDVEKIPTVIVYDKTGAKLGNLDVESSSVEQSLANLVK